MIQSTVAKASICQFFALIRASLSGWMVSANAAEYTLHENCCIFLLIASSTSGRREASRASFIFSKAFGSASVSITFRTA